MRITLFVMLFAGVAVAQSQAVKDWDEAIKKFEKEVAKHRDASNHDGPRSTRAANLEERVDAAKQETERLRQIVRRQFVHREEIAKHAIQVRKLVATWNTPERARALATLDRGIQEMGGIKIEKFRKALGIYQIPKSVDERKRVGYNVSVTAPVEKGAYELRLYVDGNELATERFQVTDPIETDQRLRLNDRGLLGDLDETSSVVSFATARFVGCTCNCLCRGSASSDQNRSNG